MTSPVRVLIADDHPLFRLGLKFALQAQGFEVVAEAETGSQAVQYCRSCPIDVAILDVRMPDGDGIAACQQITELGLPVVVVMMTTFQEPGLIEAARRAGAKGYLSKETDPAELARVIRQILSNPERDWLPARQELPKLTPPRAVCAATDERGLGQQTDRPPSGPEHRNRQRIRQHRLPQAGCQRPRHRPAQSTATGDLVNWRKGLGIPPRGGDLRRP